MVLLFFRLLKGTLLGLLKRLLVRYGAAGRVLVSWFCTIICMSCSLSELFFFFFFQSEENDISFPPLILAFFSKNSTTFFFPGSVFALSPSWELRGGLFTFYSFFFFFLRLGSECTLRDRMG